jgi:hypothetical protein
MSLWNHDGTKTQLMMTSHTDVFQSGSEHPLHTRGWTLQEGIVLTPSLTRPM